MLLGVISVCTHCIRKQEGKQWCSRGSIVLWLILFKLNGSLHSCKSVPFSWIYWSHIHQKSHHFHPDNSYFGFYWLPTDCPAWCHGEVLPLVPGGSQITSAVLSLLGMRETPWENVRSDAGICHSSGGGKCGWGPAAGASVSPPYRPPAQWGQSSRQDLRLWRVMLPAWRGRPGGDWDIWWEFLMAELCVGLGCQLI